MASYSDGSRALSNTTSTDRYFPTLPFELRLMIWELTLTPRVISLICEQTYYADFDGEYRYVPAPKNLVPFEFAVADNDIPVVSALYICRESRQFALNRGYRPWKLHNLSNEIKLVMWNPAMDTVSLGESTAPCDAVRMLSERYPSETQHLQHMALLSSYWDSWNNSIQLEREDLWVQFGSLGELCVVIDLPIEYQNAAYAKLPPQENPRVPPKPWAVPFDIEEEFEDYQREVPDFQIPVVRVVESEEGILSGQAKEILLRCHPCDDMYYLLQTERARELIEAAQDENIKTHHNKDVGRFPPEWFVG